MAIMSVIADNADKETLKNKSTVDIVRDGGCMPSLPC